MPAVQRLLRVRAASSVELRLPYTCYCVGMPMLLCRHTNLALDDKLLEEALRLGGLKTKKATVNAALLEFVNYRKQQEIKKLFGTIEFHPGWTAKKQRNKG